MRKAAFDAWIVVHTDKAGNPEYPAVYSPRQLCFREEEAQEWFDRIGWPDNQYMAVVRVEVDMVPIHVPEDTP